MEEHAGAKKYRVSIDLVKRYETYVYARDVAEAARIGREALENDEGDFVDDHYADDSLKVVEMRKYKATQTVTYTYAHHMYAADNDEAMIYAKRQFSEDMHNVNSSVNQVASPIKLEWLE